LSYCDQGRILLLEVDAPFVPHIREFVVVVLMSYRWLWIK
jgi:hypothetical protein